MFILYSLSSGAEECDGEDINEDYDKGYSELNNEIDGQVVVIIWFMLHTNNGSINLTKCQKLFTCF